MYDIDFSVPPTPCYVVDEHLLKDNLKILKYVEDEAGCKILLAQKAFSMFSLYPLIGRYLCGAASSSLFEARLAYEEMGKEVHIYSPAYREDEFDGITRYCDHIVFNSFAQWEKFKPKIAGSSEKISCGLRVNPEYSEIQTEIYNPCAAGSRLGITARNFSGNGMGGIEGLHFHTMCEQGADVLERTVRVFDDKFGMYLKNMKWVNFGGGQHITKKGYCLKKLINSVKYIKEKYGVDVYLEPGEAVALNTGFLVSTVLDITENSGIETAVLDASAACHMPDVLEMPYRPEIIGAGKPGEYAHTYRLGGPTCLAGDIIGSYSFKHKLNSGDRLVFCDMAHYTMVKNNTFNGENLPAIVLHGSGGFHVIRKFGYDDFKTRLS
ncbi:MAG TPA: carboxynorspermidine decarboxylase [Ruminococcaceae bacterium]|nr:carboxynorspermidine decarboxylase [Oscillospiraceae bacterium]